MLNKFCGFAIYCDARPTCQKFCLINFAGDSKSAKIKLRKNYVVYGSDLMSKLTITSVGWRCMFFYTLNKMLSGQPGDRSEMLCILTGGMSGSQCMTQLSVGRHEACGSWVTHTAWVVC